MNCFNYEMIRLCRMCFLGKKPFLIQRTSFLPDQLFVSFSSFFEPRTDFELKILNQQKREKSYYGPTKARNILNYNLLKEIVQGTAANYGSPEKKEMFFKEFVHCLKNYPPNEIIKTLKLLVYSKKRPVIAMQSMCDVLAQEKDYRFSAWECSDFMFCLSKLHFRHEAATLLMINYLKENVNDFDSPQVLTSLLHSFSLLRIRDPELLEMLIKSQIKFRIDVKESLSPLVACSILNFSSSYLDELIKPLSKLKEIDFYQIKDYVTFVWTCVLLEKFDYISEHLPNVLSFSFLEKLGYGLIDLNRGLKLKLLNINAAASIISTYKGPFLDILQDYKSFYEPNEKSEFLDSVRDSLVYTVSKSGSIECLVDTGKGFYLDLECHLNAENSVNLLSKPVEHLKLGIMLLKYYDICSDGTMTGNAALKQKVLEAQGYKVITIPYYEYPLNDKLSKKIGYLRKKILLVVQDTQDISEIKEKSKESA